MKHILATVQLALVAAVVAALAGCEQVEPPNFRLNMVRMVGPNNNEIGPEYRQEIANVLDGLFGTPDKPIALADSGLSQTRLDLSAGPAWSDEGGVGHGLYRKHCVHCHGVSGDGRGPTARFLNPYPRDYRMGTFKFKSNANAARPTDEDLRRILWNGAPGTSMPSFSLLGEGELESLVEYVKYLAMRGEAERALADYVYNELGEDEVEGEDGTTRLVRIPLNPVDGQYADEQREAIAEIVAGVVEAWGEANDSIVVPADGDIPDDDRSAEEIAASVAKGRELFYDKRANCYTCHGPTGLGDGQTTDYDNWTKEQLAVIEATTQLEKSIAEDRAAPELDEEGEAELAVNIQLLADRKDVLATLYPVRNAIPRNLRAGVYRGGRRRVDVFWRIHEGIPGSPMPGAGATLSNSEIWNIVDYVLSLPYEAASTPQKALPTNIQAIAK
ncbi:MAG: c-type cytochrome [Pirellulales bacterium]|nr:c-type cytochrome [Pirellulales bacterium]